MNKKITKAIVLAGGEGTRLRPVTYEIPKSLLTVHRKPIVSYLVDLFRHHGVEEIKVIIRPQDKEEFDWWLRRWSENHHGVRVSFGEEAQPMGTMGYWFYKLESWTGDESFFVTNGDELKEVDLTAMSRHHERASAAATLAFVHVPNPKAYGVGRFDGDRVVEFIEKPQNPPSEFANSGLYIIDPSVRAHIGKTVRRKRQFLMAEHDLFPELARLGQLAGFRGVNRWYDCGTLERWEKAMREWPKS